MNNTRSLPAVGPRTRSSSKSARKRSLCTEETRKTRTAERERLSRSYYQLPATTTVALAAPRRAALQVGRGGAAHARRVERERASERAERSVRKEEKKENTRRRGSLGPSVARLGPYFPPNLATPSCSALLFGVARLGGKDGPIWQPCSWLVAH